MFWKYAPLIAQIDSLLEKEDVTLTAILDEDDVLQECRCQNAKLVTFLTTPEHLLTLVKYVTEDPPSDADDAMKYKYPNIACELLSCDVTEINDALTKDDEYLELLYAFLKAEPPLNPLTASFFVKVMGMLTQKKSERVFNFVKEKDDFLQLLLSHIGTSAIVDYFVRMLRDPEPDEMKNKFVEWISEQGLVRKLLAGMDPSQDSDKHYHTSQCVCEIISLCRESLSQCQENADVSILLDSLESSSTVTELLTFMFEDEAPKETVLVNGLKIILMLFNKRKNDNQGGVLDPGNLSNLVSENDLVRLAQAATNAIEAVLPKLSSFVRLLRNPPEQHYRPMPTTNGTLDPPLGSTRLCIVALIDALLSVNAPVANLAIHEHKLLSIVLDLFMAYPMNSFLHHTATAIVTSVLTSGTPQEETINKLQHQLLVECDLIGRLLKAYDSTRGAAADEENGDNGQCEAVKAYRRDGHIAHVFKMANTLKENLASGNHKDYLSDLLERSDERLKARWSEFVLGPLQTSNDNSMVDPLPNDDSLGNMSDLPRLGQEEFGFLEDEFDQQQQHDKFEALFAKKTSELTFDLGSRERTKEEDEDNLWEELSALSPRRNEDGIRRDTRLVGFSSDNGDDEPDVRASAGDDEEESSSDEEDLDSPLVIRQRPRGEPGAPSARTAGPAQSGPAAGQEAMDVDDSDEWAVFDNRPRQADALPAADSPAASPATSPAASGPATGPGDAPGWADFSSAPAAPANDAWADFGPFNDAAPSAGDDWADFAAAAPAASAPSSGAAMEKPWAAFASGGTEMDTSSSGSSEEEGQGPAGPTGAAERGPAGKKRPTADLDATAEGNRPSSSPDRNNGPV